MGVKIKVKKGFLKLPEGQSFVKTPIKHFVEIAKKEGYAKVARRVNVLKIYNKNKRTKMANAIRAKVDKILEALRNQFGGKKIKANINLITHYVLANIEMYARNIANLDEVSSFLNDLKEEFKDYPNILQWINKPLQKYIKEELEDTERVTKVKKDYPDWLKKAIEENQEVLRIRITTSFKTRVINILDYFMTLPKTTNLLPITFKVAEAKAIKYREDKSKEDLSEKALEGEISITLPDKDGFIWKDLVSKDALVFEGRRMKHCVGDEQQNYIKNVANKKLKIFSLRDKNNIPHCTMEFEIESRSEGKIVGNIKQIKGNANGPIKQEYVKKCEMFLKHPPKSIKIEEVRDLKNIGILEQEGKWYSIYHLPKNFTVEGDLDLENTSITSLPEGLTVGGGLYLRNTSITSLPEGLTVEGYLDLRNTSITSLPEGLTVEGYLDLEGTPITSLSEGLKIGGDLDLENTPITSLPEGLTVGGSLYLIDTSITSLPEGLTIGGSLDLRYTKVTSLSEGLKIGGDLDLENTPITSLPEGLTVGGNLDIEGTPITSLPEGLTIGGSLYLIDTPITSLPKDLYVKKFIRVDKNFPIEKYPHLNFKVG